MKKSIEEVIDSYGESDVGIHIALIGENTILLEGNAETLKFLGELLLAMSNSSDCGIQFTPNGAGRRFFVTSSRYGFYIHRPEVCHDATHSKASRRGDNASE